MPDSTKLRLKYYTGCLLVLSAIAYWSVPAAVLVAGIGLIADAVVSPGKLSQSGQ